MRALALVALGLATCVAGAPAPKLSLSILSNSSFLNDYQNCYYIWSVAGNRAGAEVLYTPFSYTSAGVPCIVNYGSSWTNNLNEWAAGNTSTIADTSSGKYWNQGSQYPLLYPANKSILFPTNYDVIAQSFITTPLALQDWGINNFPYSNYDWDNFGIAAKDNVLFYSYQYRQGQGYQLLVSFIALNMTTQSQIQGFYYQGLAYSGGYPTGGVATLSSAFPGVNGTGNYTGGVALVFFSGDGSLWVSTLNNTVNVTTLTSTLFPSNITNVYGIATSPVHPDTHVLALLSYTPSAAADEVVDTLALKTKMSPLSPLSRSLLSGAHVKAAVGGAPTVTRLYHVNVVNLTIEDSVVVPDATAMTVGWRNHVAVVSHSAATILDAGTFQVEGSTPLSTIDYYGPYVPATASFGTGFVGDDSALLHFSSTGTDGPGLSSLRVRAA